MQAASHLEAAVDEGEAGSGRERVRDHRPVAVAPQLLDQLLDLGDLWRTPELQRDRGDIGSTVPGRDPGDAASEADGLRLHRRRAYALPRALPRSREPVSTGLAAPPGRRTAGPIAPLGLSGGARVPIPTASTSDARPTHGGSSRVGSRPAARLRGGARRVGRPPQGGLPALHSCRRSPRAARPCRRVAGRDGAHRVRGHAETARRGVHRDERGRLRVLGFRRRPVPRERDAPARIGRPGAPPGAERDPVVRGARTAAGRAEARRARARSRARHRSDRLGEDHDARLDDRLHQRDPAQAHRDDRGPDRDPARRQGGDRQPARGRNRHRRLPRRARSGCCARTPT